MKSVRVFAPATVSNVSCGFDVLGFAMEEPGDEVLLTLTAGKDVVIKAITPEGIRLPWEAERNTATVAIQSFLKSIHKEQGVEVEIHKKLPLGSGLGSSASSAVAAVFGINHLLGNPVSTLELLPHAMEAERVACGSAHADNVAPSLLGGFVLIRDYNPLDVIQVPVTLPLFCAVVHPHIELRTEDSRKVLKQQIPLSDAVTQTGNIAGLMIGLMHGDSGLVSRSLRDVIAEPYRSGFIPGFDEIKSATVQAGALGSGISGSGPTVFSLCANKSTAQEIGQLIQSIFRKHKVESDVFVSTIHDQGARIIS